MARWLVPLLLACAALTAGAREAAPAADDPALEARMLRIASELRCLVCQNQTIADSHAALAEDLREQVRELLRRGQSDADVVAYMTARYGDFVLYRPPLKASTVALWAGPPVMLVAGIAGLLLLLRRRARLPDEAFEPDAPEAAHDPHLS
jgi:cytochrome c-type biogenesis protein CcmH